MPYNTRRKSLSLPSLGIQLPGNHASRAARRSSPASAGASPRHSPPAKRVKRSHTVSSAAPSPSTNIAAPAPTRPARPASASPTARAHADNAVTTPPPSPGAHHIAKLDFDGINDDIVVGVLQQLQSTGNRPHLIKELAAVLITSLRSVESSSNPTAIISSRLTNYLRRPWTALAPCPLTKEQVAVHPRRVYYYLTTCPRQEIPEFAGTPQTKRIISPSLSSGPEDEGEADGDGLGDVLLEDAGVFTSHSPSIAAYEPARSPSPDLDFSAGALDFDSAHPLPVIPFDHPTSYVNMSHNRRAASPPLELDEREFTQTASSMQQRRHDEAKKAKVAAAAAAAAAAATPPSPDSAASMDGSTADETALSQFTLECVLDTGDESDVDAARRNHEAAAALFGPSCNHLQTPDVMTNSFMEFSSPMLRPQVHFMTTPKKAFAIVGLDGYSRGEVEYDEHGHHDKTMLDAGFSGWGDLKSPEQVGLAELDDLLGGF